MTREAESVDVLVGKVMRELRDSAGLTQAQLGAVMKISAAQVQKYEFGANRLSAQRLFELARYFGVSVEDFYRYVEPTACDKGGAPTKAHFYQTDEGRKLAADYCNLPPAYQQAVQAMISTLKTQARKA
ncbi:MAG: helix-turn-helix domain-containing protein [Asticcacaulis sp.]|uniref:helix-turn-helix domain-containing protein n=1 Tax=Asticcacaulis sp. TaxID=1872648 RepID=UPI003F7BD5A1